MTKAEKLVKKYHGANLSIIEVIYDNANKCIIVDYDFLTKYFNVGKAAISSWFSKKGAEFKTPYSIKYWTDLKYIIDWHRENIDKSKSMQGAGLLNKIVTDTEETDSEIDFLDTLPTEIKLAYETSAKDPLDKLKDVKEIEKRNIALEKEKGALVSSDIPDKAMAELALIQIGLYRQDIVAISSKIMQLDNINNKSVKDLLEAEYKQRINSLKKIASIDSNSKIYDLIEAMSKKLEEKSVDEILEAINEL